VLAGLLWGWAPVLLWMALILMLSSRSDFQTSAPAPVAESQGVFFAVSKLAHVVEYSVLGLLLLRALYGAGGGLCWPLGLAVVASVLASGLFGALDELRQSFVPNRSPRLADIALDTASALSACLVVCAWLCLRRTRQSVPARSPVRTPPLPRAGEGIGG
jgi:VanZ family protein